MTQRAKEMLELADKLEARLTADRHGKIDPSLGIKIGPELCQEVFEAVTALRLAAQADAPGGLDAATVEACAKIARSMREKHGSPTGDAYSNGVWDQGVRIEQAIRALTSGKKP